MLRNAIDAFAIVACLTVCSTAPVRADDGLGNDYPTETRADYVFGCMVANGQTRDALHRCSCSVDVIASILPYDRYVEAETILSMRQGVGQSANLFRATKQYNDVIADLRRTQAEAEIRCFK